MNEAADILEPERAEISGVRAIRLRRLVVPSEKSKDFFARLLVRRNTPGNCTRCGHKNPQPKHKTCPRCLDAVRRRKLNALTKPVLPQRGELEAMQRRISSLEMSVANLQISHAKIYERAYNAGRKSIRVAVKRIAAEVQRAEDRRYEMPTIHPQELATMNHAYDRA